MYTQKKLAEQMKEMNIDPSGTLMVHLSYKAIGEVEGRGDGVLDVLMAYMAPGLLVMPGHTWNNVDVDNPVMDVLYTPSCVGKVPELFRKRPGVYRSLHPTHSLMAYGAEAEVFLSGEEHVQTPCGSGGAYYRLWERDAQILLIGVDFSKNTYLHGVEEWDGAEEILASEKADCYVIHGEGRRLHTPQYRHCAPLGSERFMKLMPQAMQEGIVTEGLFGGAAVYLMRAKPLREMTAELLRRDARYFLR